MMMGSQAEADFARPTDRRRRNIAVVMAAVAVLALGTAFVWWRVGAREPVVTPAAPGTSTTTSSTTSSATSTSATTTSAAPTGDADASAPRVTVDPAAPLVERPGIPYLLDTTLHRGSMTRSFPVKPVFEYLPLAEGRALLLDEFHGYEWDRLQLLDANGATVLSSTAQPMHFLWAVADGAGRRFVVMDSPDGGRSAAVLTLHDSAGTVQLKRTGVPDWLRLVGFVGDRVFLGSAAEKGGTYAWDVGNNTLSPYAAWTVGSVNEPSGRAAFTGPGEWAQPRCTLVADVRGPSPVPVSTTCGLFTLIEFSPDGRYLLGSLVEPEDPPFISPPRVIDAQTGRPVLVFDAPTPMVVRAAFLDDGSVGLALMLGNGTAWSTTIVRCSLDRDCTRMAETVSTQMSDEGPRARYHFARD